MNVRTVLVDAKDDTSVSGCLSRFTRLSVVHADTAKAVEMQHLYSQKKTMLWFVRDVKSPVAVESLTRLQARMNVLREQGIVVAVIAPSSPADLVAVKEQRGFDMELFSDPKGDAYSAFPDFKYQSTQSLCAACCACLASLGGSAPPKPTNPRATHTEMGGVLVVAPVNRGRHTIIYSYACNSNTDHVNLDTVMAAYRSWSQMELDVPQQKEEQSITTQFQTVVNPLIPNAL